MPALEPALRADQRLTVACSSWPDGTCKCMIWEAICALKAMLNEEKGDPRDRIGLVPAAQWMPNMIFSEKYGSTPYHVMYGRVLQSRFVVLMAGVYSSSILCHYAPNFTVL